MKLFDNPFYIIGANSRDDRRRIMELHDEQSFNLDNDICSSAKQILTNPRKRLAAEVAWLPGLSPKYASTVLAILRNSPYEVLEMTSVPSLAFANILATCLTELSDENWDLQIEIVKTLAITFDTVDHLELAKLISEDRAIAGFPDVLDQRSIEHELRERQKFYRDTVKSLFNKIESRQLVRYVTEIVELMTDSGKKHAPVLIDEMVDMYEVEAQEFFNKEEENITNLTGKLRQSVVDDKSEIESLRLLKQLISVVRNWDTVAQPIQVSTRSRGVKHVNSHRVATKLRSLSISLFNEYNRLYYAQQLTALLNEVFAEVIEAAEIFTEDSNYLDKIVNRRAQEQKNAELEAYEKEIFYEATYGLIFKKKIKISTNGLEWYGRKYELNTITKVRWGVERSLLGEITSGTKYNITIAGSNFFKILRMPNKIIYENVIDRLWKAIGDRLITDLLKSLKAGNSHQFGNVRVFDHGVDLVWKRILRKNQIVRCAWKETSHYSENGRLYIISGDRRMSTSTSYHEDDNIPVLSALLHLQKKYKLTKMSDMLDIN